MMKRSIWIGLELPAPNYPQRVEPLTIVAFATEQSARQWQREHQITANSPLRQIYKREVQR